MLMAAAVVVVVVVMVYLYEYVDEPPSTDQDVSSISGQVAVQLSLAGGAAPARAPLSVCTYTCLVRGRCTHSVQVIDAHTGCLQTKAYTLL